MTDPAVPEMRIDAEVNVPVARAQLVCFDMAVPIDNVLQVENTYWLDFSLTPRPRNARGCYRDRWEPGRFERLGNVFLLPAGEALQTRSDGCSVQSSVLCHLHPEPIREWFDGDLQWTDQRLRASLDITESSVRSLLVRLAAELRQPGFASATLVELIVSQLAIELSRYCARITERPGGGGLAPWRMRLVEERLREGGDVPSLAELAGLCGLSVRQLTRGFRATRGCSIGEYIEDLRIERARQMLATEASVKAVAYTLGFASPSGFCYAFRRATGETPGQFRQRRLRTGH